MIISCSYVQFLKKIMQNYAKVIQVPSTLAIFFAKIKV